MISHNRMQVAAVITALWSMHVVAQDAIQNTSLPEPLTLEYALSLADEAHPDLERMAAERDLAEAEYLQADSSTGVNTSLEATARWVDPSPLSPDQKHNDSRVELSVRKRLYDFGRTEALRTAGKYLIKSADLKYIDARNNRYLTIMARYFDVMLADLEYLRDNEDMATQFVSLDKLRDRNSLGQVSDIEVLEQQAKYENIRRARYASDSRQRIARARLANVLNRPGQLSSTLVEPQLTMLDRKLEDVETLQQQAVENNYTLLAMRKKSEAAMSRLNAARAGNRPVLTGEISVHEFERKIGSRDDVRAGMTLEIPLTTGGRVDADIARYRAELRRATADLTALQRNIRQQVLELWMKLDTLRIKREEMRALTNYRDLYLDRSRALYEMEVKTDLGDSMVKISDARLQTARTNFEITLAWAQMDALLGKPANETEVNNK